MFPHSNLHSHTNFSDGRNTPREMVEQALKLGFVSYGFSDHGYAPHDGASMKQEDEPKYRETVRALQKEYEGRIELYLGYEHDLTMPDTDLDPYDYFIESLHFLPCEGEWLPVDHTAETLRHIVNVAYGGNALAMAEDYFDRIRCGMHCGGIVGHLDLITKFNERDPLIDVTDDAYLEAAIPLLARAAELHMPVEINTGAISRGYRTNPYPDARLLTEFRKMGGRITITSDCHRAEWIDTAFDRAAELARACGFKETYILKNGGLEAVGL